MSSSRGPTADMMTSDIDFHELTSGHEKKRMLD